MDKKLIAAAKAEIATFSHQVSVDVASLETHRLIPKDSKIKYTYQKYIIYKKPTITHNISLM